VPILLLQASARSDGNTHQVATKLVAEFNARHLDLLDYVIYPFRYKQEYPTDDDFLRLIEEEVLAHDHIVFASPVYWYSMSGGLKIFFDRLSDLLKSRKDLGRRLRGKRMSVLSVSNDAAVNDSFFDAFRLSAEYLGMEYGGEWHGWVEEDSATDVRRN